MRQPTVSIIIPVRNAVDTLQHCIDSVLMQSFPSWQILIIDGGSTDSTLQVIEKNKMHLHHFSSEPDNGVYAAINKGIDRSSGEWIYILGADDFLADANVLQNIFSHRQYAERVIAGMVKNENVNHPLVPDTQQNSFSKKLYWKNTMHQQGVFYHYSLFKSFRFREDLKVLADYDFHLKLLYDGEHCFSISVVVAHCGSAGLSKQFNRALYLEELKVKRTRLGPWLYMANIPWVWLKFLSKKIV
ncbi:MAG: glycosyltransferase family 2 protein [Flavobacteriales bacterium]